MGVAVQLLHISLILITLKIFGGAWTRFGGPVPPWIQPRTATGYIVLYDAAAVIGLRLHYLVSISCIAMGIYVLLIK